MGYEFLDHTADVKFRASGVTLSEAFLSSASALFVTMYGDLSITGTIEKKIVITGTDMQQLLYNFLEEFIFLLDSEDFVCSSIEQLAIDGLSLTAILKGDAASTYSFVNSVKAPTYNDMSIEQTSQGYEIVCVLDV